MRRVGRPAGDQTSALARGCDRSMCTKQVTARDSSRVAGGGSRAPPSSPRAVCTDPCPASLEQWRWRACLGRPALPWQAQTRSSPQTRRHLAEPRAASESPRRCAPRSFCQSPGCPQSGRSDSGRAERRPALSPSSPCGRRCPRPLPLRTPGPSSMHNPPDRPAASAPIIPSALTARPCCAFGTCGIRRASLLRALSASEGRRWR